MHLPAMSSLKQMKRSGIIGLNDRLLLALANSLPSGGVAMDRKAFVVPSIALVFLSVLGGLVWWMIGFHIHAFQRPIAGGMQSVLIGLAMFQIVSWGVIAASIWYYRRRQRELESWPLLFVSALLALGTLLWGFTPVVGAPPIFAAVAGAVLLLIRTWRYDRRFPRGGATASPQSPK